MSTATELNRRVAKAKGWTEYLTNHGPLWCDSAYPNARNATSHNNGYAWADSADVALRELLPDVHDRGWILCVNVTCAYFRHVENNERLLTEATASLPLDNSRTWSQVVAIAITEAWLAVHE